MSQKTPTLKTGVIDVPAANFVRMLSAACKAKLDNVATYQPPAIKSIEENIKELVDLINSGKLFEKALPIDFQSWINCPSHAPFFHQMLATEQKAQAFIYGKEGSKKEVFLNIKAIASRGWDGILALQGNDNRGALTNELYALCKILEFEPTFSVLAVTQNEKHGFVILCNPNSVQSVYQRIDYAD